MTSAFLTDFESEMFQFQGPPAAGERNFEQHPRFPCTEGVPIMKGFMCPVALVHTHHLTSEQVAHVYETLYMFTFAFHSLIDVIVRQATHTKKLKEKIWRTFAELWQAALGVQFPTEVLTILHERDAALSAVAKKSRDEQKGKGTGIDERYGSSLRGTAVLRKAANTEALEALCAVRASKHESGFAGARRCWIRH